MSVTTRRRAFIAAFSLALFTACGAPQTSVTQVWRAQLASPMKSVLVFSARMDETNRRVVEDAMVAELTKRGVSARASYVLFPGAPPEREKARDMVKQMGFEGVLVATLKNVREKTTVIAGSYHGGFWTSYYGQGWGYYDPGYVISDKVVSFETTLWDAREEDKLVWSATLETTNPSEGGEYVKGLTDSVVSSLDKNGLLPKKE